MVKCIVSSVQLICFGNPREQLPADDAWVSGVYFPTNPREQGCEYRVSVDSQVIDGKHMPLWLELESVWQKDDLGEPMWFARIELRDGIPKIANIGFISDEDEREVKWSDYQRTRSAIYVFYAAFCADIGLDGKPLSRSANDKTANKRIESFIEEQRTGRRVLTTEDYKYAAQIYRENFDGTPRKAIAEAFGVKDRRAGDIVAECRRRGFLSKTTKQGKKQI